MTIEKSDLGNDENIFLMAVYGLTNKGKLRARNEDSILLGPWMSGKGEEAIHSIKFSSHKPQIVSVADGIGGHKGGDYASSYLNKTLS